jgi:hypothetical protein
MGILTHAAWRRTAITPSSLSNRLIPVPSDLRGRLSRPAGFHDRVKLNVLWPRFMAICEALQGDDAELTCEEFASFYEAYSGLQLLGVTFDETFVDAVEFLHRDLIGTDADGDYDDADERIDLDDSDEDNDANALAAVPLYTIGGGHA